MEDDLLINTTDESESEESSTDASSDDDTSDGESIDDTESVIGEQDEADSNSAVEMIQNEVTSDSNDERETCPICLSRFIGQDLGSPESCNHTFCLECVLEWSKNINTCPIDRSEFHSIHVKPSPDGKVIKKIKVKVVPKADEFELPEDTSTCEVCQSGENEDRLLLCDGCDLAYHCECLDPPLYSIPIEEWFCPPCSAVLQNSASHSGHGRQRRVIPRTRASEVVRSRIENLRNFTSSKSASASSSIQRKASTSRQVSKKPRKRRRRRYYTKVIKYARTKQSVSNSGKGKGSARNVVLVRCKTRRRRRRKTRVKRLSSTSKGKQPLSSKKRLATQLGLGKPLPGHVMPTVKKSSGSMLISNQPSHSLFGNRNQLMDFSESYDDDALSTNTSIPSSSSRPMSSKQVISSSPINILDSILAGQELLHKKAQDIVIRQDGSLIIKKEKDCVKVVPKKEMGVKEKLKKANPTHIALMKPNVISAREMEESNLENARKVANSNSSSMGARPKTKSIAHDKASGSKRDQISSSCKSDKSYNSSRSFKEPYDFSKAGPSSCSHNNKKHRNVLPKPLKITSVRSLSCSSEENADFDDNPFMKKAKRLEKLARLSRSDSDGNVGSDFNPVYDRGGYEEEFLTADATRRHTKLRDLLAAEEPSNPYRNYGVEDSRKKNETSHYLTKREKSGSENRVKKEKVEERDASHSLAEKTTAELLNHRKVLSSKSHCKTYVKREIVSSDEDTYLPDTHQVHHDEVIVKSPKWNSLGVRNSSCGKRQDLPETHNAEKVRSKFANSFQSSSVAEINHNESTSNSSRDQQLGLYNVQTSTCNIKQELSDIDHDKNVRHKLMDSLHDNVQKLIKEEIIPEQESVKVSLVQDAHVGEKHNNEAKSTLNCSAGERGDKNFEDDHNSRNLSCMLQKVPNQIKKERSNDNDKELPSAKSSPKKTFKLIKIEETNLDAIPGNAEESEISKLLSSIGVSDVTQLNSFIRDNPLFFNDPFVPALLNMEFLTQCFGNKPKDDPISEKCHNELFRDLPKTKNIDVLNELKKTADSRKEDQISSNLHLPLKILTAHRNVDGSESNPGNKYKEFAVKKPMHRLFSEIPAIQLIHSNESNTLNSENRSSDHFNNSCDLEFPATQRVNLKEQFIKSKINNESSIKTNYNKNCYFNESDGLPATQQIDIFDNNSYSRDNFTKNCGYVNDSLPSKIGSFPKVEVLEPTVENNVNKAKECFRSKNIFDDFLPATQKMESINAALQNAINRNKKYSENDNSIDELPATQKTEFPEPALPNKMIQARKSKYGNFDDLPCTQEIDSFDLCSKTKMNETKKHSKSNNSINKLPATQKAEFLKPAYTASLNKINRKKFSTNDSLGSDEIGELLVGFPQTNTVGDPVEKFFNYMQESFDEFPATQLIQSSEKKLENKISQAEKITSTEVLQATQMNLLTDDLPDSDMKHNFNEEMFNNIMQDSSNDLPATQAIQLPSQKSQKFSSQKSPATLGKECIELNAESKPNTNSIKRKFEESRHSLDELTNTQSVLSPVSNSKKDIRKCSDKDVSKIRREVKTSSYSKKSKSKEDILKPRPKISQLNYFNKLPETQDSRCSLDELPDTQYVLSPVSNREKDLRKCSDKDVSKIRREDKTNSYSHKLKSKEDILKARPKIFKSNDFNKLPETQAVLVSNHRKLHHQKFVRKAKPTDFKPSRKQKHDLTHHASQNTEISHANEDNVVVHTHNEKPSTQTNGSDNSHNDDASRRNTGSETNAQVVETNKDMHSHAEMEETSENSEKTQPMRILDGLSPLEAQMLMKQCGIQAMALKSTNRQSAIHRNLPTVVASIRSKVLPKPKGSLKVSYSDSVADVLCLTDVRTRTDSESSSNNVLKTARLCVDNVKKECNSDNETVSSDHEDDDVVSKHLTVEAVMCVDDIKKEKDNSNDDVENHLDLMRKCHNDPKTMVGDTNLKAKNQQLVAQDSITRTYKEVLKDKSHDGKIDPFTMIEKQNIDLKRIANDSHSKNRWDNDKRTSEAEQLLQEAAKNAQLQDFLSKLVDDDDDIDLPATQLVISPAGMQHTRYPSQDVSLRRNPDMCNRTSDKKNESHTNVLPHDSQSFKSDKTCTNNSKTVSQRDHKHSSIAIKTEAVSDDAAFHTVNTEVYASIKVKQEVLSDVEIIPDDYNCSTSKQIKQEVLSDDEVIPIDIDTVSNANQELGKKIKVKCKVISDGVGEVASDSTKGWKKQNLIQRIKIEPGLNEGAKCYRKEAHKDVRKQNDPLLHNVNIKGEILSDDSSTGGSCRTEKSTHRQAYKSTDTPVHSHQLTSPSLNKSNSQSHILFNHFSVTTCEVVNETKRSEAVAIVKPVKRKHSSPDQNSVMHSDKFSSESERCEKINHKPNSASKANISVDKKYNLSSRSHSTSASKTHMTRVVKKPLCSPNPNDRILEKANRPKVSENSVKTINSKAAVTVKAEKHKHSFTEDSSDVSHDNIRANHEKNSNKKYSSSSKRYKTDTSPHSRHESYLSDCSSQSKSRCKYGPKEAERRSSVSSRASNSSHSRSSPHKSNQHRNIRLERHASKSKDKKYLNSEFKDKRRNGKMDDLDLSSNSSNSKNLIVPKSEGDASSQISNLRKADLKEMIAEEVKTVLKPFYMAMLISKEDYKDIMRRAVPKIFLNSRKSIDREKIEKLVKQYISYIND